MNERLERASVDLLERPISAAPPVEALERRAHRRRRRRQGVVAASLVAVAGVTVGGAMLAAGDGGDGSQQVVAASSPATTAASAVASAPTPTTAAPSASAIEPAPSEPDEPVRPGDLLPGLDLFGGLIGELQINVTTGPEAADIIAQAEANHDKTLELAGQTAYVTEDGETSTLTFAPAADIAVEITGPTAELDQLKDLIAGFDVGIPDLDQFLDDFEIPDLDRFFDDFQLPGFAFPFGLDATVVPDGYEAHGGDVRLDGGGPVFVCEFRETDGDGRLSIELSPDASLPDGDEQAVRGTTDGRYEDDGDTVVAWIEDKLLLAVRANELSLAELLEVAEGLELNVKDLPFDFGFDFGFLYPGEPEGTAA